MESNGQRKVLLVDDSPTQLTKVKFGLEDEGFRVITASDGVDGVSRVYEHNPDIVVSDIEMPELDGYQLCRLIKNDPELSHIPVILLTHRGQQHDKFWGREAGADFYVVKEKDLSPLFETLQKSIELSQMKTKGKSTPQKRESMTGDKLRHKVTELLDDLLLESTIAGRIREISRFAYDIDELMENLFTLFSDLLDSSVACLAVEDGDFITLHMKCLKNYDERVIEKVKQDVWNAYSGVDRKLRIKYYGKTCEEPGRRSAILKSKLIFPFQVKEDMRAVMALFDERNEMYRGKALRIVKKVCAELDMLIKYMAKLNEIEKIKADFTSMIVHDLRSPLAGVFGLLKLMRKDRLGKVNEKQKQTLSQILGTINKLLNLVNDMLDVSKLESGHLDVFPKKVSFNEILEEALHNIEILAEEKSIEICVNDVSNPIYVSGDALRLEQVLINLLSNAIKFSNENSRIIVSTRKDENPNYQQRRLIVSVQDFGIGIDEESIDLIFDKYRQTKKGTIKAAKGTGLGLAICKMIVEAHDGKIWATSKEKQGSIFSFTLPLAN